MVLTPGTKLLSSIKKSGEWFAGVVFGAKTKQLAALYGSFTVLDTVHIKGALTLGENTRLITGALR